MITVKFGRKIGPEGVVTVHATGHAGYAEEGRDIVCASVSSLILALSAYAEGERGFSRLGKGDMLVGLFTKGDEARGAVAVAYYGLLSLQEGLADYVSVEASADFQEWLFCHENMATEP